jgi:hypothetical protein
MQSKKIEVQNGCRRSDLRGTNDQQEISSASEKPKQDLLDEILTCWRWARSLDHRLDVYRLQFEHDVTGALDTDYQALANEISSFRTVIHELAR